MILKSMVRYINLFIDNPEIPVLFFNCESYNYEKFISFINNTELTREMLLNDEVIDGKLCKLSINIKDVLTIKFLIEIFQPKIENSIYYDENLTIINKLFDILKEKILCIKEPELYFSFIIEKTSDHLKWEMEHYINNLLRDEAEKLGIENSLENRNKILSLLNFDSEILIKKRDEFAKNTILDKNDILLGKINKDIKKLFDELLYNIHKEFTELYEDVNKNNVVLESEIDSFFIRYFNDLFKTIDFINEFEKPIYC